MQDSAREQKKLLRSFEAYLGKKHYSRNTTKNYLASIRRFATWLYESYNKPLSSSQLTSLLLEKYQAHLSSRRDLPKTTKAAHLAALRAFSAWAAYEGYLTRPIATKRKTHKSQNNIPLLWRLTSAAAITLATLSIATSLKQENYHQQTFPLSTSLKIPLEEGYSIKAAGIHVDTATGLYEVVYEIKQRTIGVAESITY